MKAEDGVTKEEELETLKERLNHPNIWPSNRYGAIPIGILCTLITDAWNENGSSRKSALVFWGLLVACGNSQASQVTWIVVFGNYSSVMNDITVMWLLLIMIEFVVIEKIVDIEITFNEDWKRIHI